MNGLSKRLVSLTMATAMVFSLTAVPATEASAATKTITAKTTSVQAGQTYTYSINAKKAKNVKISVSGAAKSGVTATVNGKKLSGKTLKGGKTLKVTIKANTKVVGKKFVVNYKLDKKATKKTKAIKVNYSAKSVSLDQTALTLEAGKTATLKATINPTTSNSTIKSWVSSDEKVATVNNGVVTAVAAGTADITVTTSNGKTAKATVTVEEKKEEVKDTVPQMTALTATAADTLKATFASAVPADAAIAVSRSKSTAGITGIATWNADRTELTYQLSSNMVADTYTMTVKVGESSTSLTYEATARKATSIEIMGETALTNPSNKKQAYVYYDIKDQYGDSVRSSTSVNITASAGTNTADRSTGKITVTSSNDFKYGDIVSVTIVDTKNGLSQSKVLTIGLEQAVDKVDVVGFINIDTPTKLLTQLPENFAKDKYVVLYQAKDQQDNVMDCTTNRLAAKKLTVTVSDPMLIDSTFVDSGKNFTLDGVTYDAFEIQPGDYSDRGGEAVLTIISNTTGTKSSYTVKVSSAGILESLSLNVPAETVADGEKTTLTYTAKDTKGNDITDFETIVRSTNKLNLNTSIGTLTVSEGNDGEAVIEWQDNDAGRDWDDGIDQPVVLTTIVVGGKTDYCQFGVSDYAYPVAFKEVHTTRWTDTIVYGGTEHLRFDQDKDYIKYVDQYGREKKGNWAAPRITAINGTAGTTHNFNSYVAIVLDTAGVTSESDATGGKFGLDEKVITSFSGVTTVSPKDVTTLANQDTLVSGSETVKFYIGATEDRTKALASCGFADFNAVGSQKAVTYTAVKYIDVKNIVVEDINALHIETEYSAYENLYDYTKKTNAATPSGNAIINTMTDKNWRTVKVVGKANNEKVYIPNMYWTNAELADNVFTVAATDNGWLDGSVIKADKNLKVGDLYNTASTTGERKTATKTLKLKIATVSGNVLALEDIIEKDIQIADANSVGTTIKFYDGLWTALTDKAIVDPTNMDIEIVKDAAKDENTSFGSNGKDKIIFQILDQYGDKMTYTNSKAKVTISDLVENTAALAHVTNSLGTLSNNTQNVKVTGAEIKDTFKFTVKAGNATGTLLVTVGGDSAANMTDGSNSDKAFREGKLNYNVRN